MDKYIDMNVFDIKNRLELITYLKGIGFSDALLKELMSYGYKISYIARRCRIRRDCLYRVHSGKTKELSKNNLLKLYIFYEFESEKHKKEGE